MSLVLLICLFIQLRLPGGAVYERRLLVKFSVIKNWNDARKVCAMSGGYLATIDEYTTSFLRQAFDYDNSNYVDNIWIGLHDATPGEGSLLRANGFIWDTCQMLGSWSNWQPGQPEDRSNNWCVRLNYKDQFRWFPEQCTSQAHYLCQYNAGACTNLRYASDGCNLQSAGLSSVGSNRTEESSCREHCFLFVNDSSSICWGFNFSSSLVCTLLVGKTPIFCSGDKTTAYNNATQTTWVRECFEVRHNTSNVDVIPNNNQFPSNHCASFSMYYPEMTSQYSERTTAVSGATVLLTHSTGMQTTSAGMVTNHSTTAEPVTSHTTTARREAATEQSTTIRAGVTNQPTELSTILQTEGVTNQPTVFITLVATTTPSAKGQVHYNFACPCVCVLDRPASSITKDSMDAIKKELAVDRSSLSSWRRKKESAPDSRVSAQATGLVGVVCLLVAACVVVVPDLSAMIQHVWTA